MYRRSNRNCHTDPVKYETKKGLKLVNKVTNNSGIDVPLTMFLSRCSTHDGPLTMFRSRCSAHDGPLTMVRSRWSAHDGPLTMVHSRDRPNCNGIVQSFFSVLCLNVWTVVTPTVTQVQYGINLMIVLCSN